jgi:hypothetical protein
MLFIPMPAKRNRLSDLLRIGRSVGVELTESLSQPGTPVTTIHPRFGQYVASSIPVFGILGRVDRFRLGQDLLDDLPSSHQRRSRNVGFDLGAVDRHHSRLNQPFGNTQRKHLPEHTGDGILMAATEPSQRGMVRLLIGRHHPKRHIIGETTLDAATGTLSTQ